MTEIDTCANRGNDVLLRPKGWGECYGCTQNNDENHHCNGYKPMKLYVFEVIDYD